VRYEEKQWMPLWVVAIFVAVPQLIVLPVILGGGSESVILDFLPALIGLALAGIFWLSTARRVIRVDGTGLRVGDRAPVPLDRIDEARIVRGAELRAVRRALLGSGPSTGAAAAGVAGAPVAGGAIGNVLLGASILRGRRSSGTRGMLAQPWMREAVVVHVAGDQRTPTLLIGTRRPQELLGALDGGRSPGFSPAAGTLRGSGAT
jgi:hypothetical protein